MGFLQPLVLLGLLAVPILVAAYVLAQRRRRKYTMRFTNLALLARVAGSSPAWRRHVPAAFFLAGLTAVVTGSALPYLNLEFARNRADVMLVVDVSGSMDATDVTPTRLGAARGAAKSLINQLPPGDRVGLVTFNQSATVVAPLSDNRDSVNRALDGLRAGGGTAIGDGIEAALGQFPVAANASAPRPIPAMIVLLTDGASNAGINPSLAAQRARAAGIPVMAVGVGARNQATYVHGQQVEGVDETTLQAIAGATGGKYFYAEGATKLDAIYRSLGSSFAWQFQRVDVTIPVLVFGGMLVGIAALANLAWFRVLP